MPHLRRSIEGVSGSPRSLPVVRYAADLARAADAAFIPVHAWVPSGLELASCQFPSERLVRAWQDTQNRVLSPESSPADVMTLRVDYSHPEIAEPLTLTVQSDSQQLLHVPFPNPPGALTAPTVLVSVLGTRAGALAGPISRVLTPDETMVVAKVYANGVITIITNKDHAAEDSVESDALGLLARLRR